MTDQIPSARLVFDLDGTLIDSAPDIQGIANALLADAGAAPISLEETHDFIGNGVEVFVQRMCAARGLETGAGERLVPAFKSRYLGAVHLTHPYLSVTDALESLSGRHRLGICTNKPHRATLSVLKHLELDSFFATVLGGDSLPQRKPDPAPLRAAFDALGHGPRIYVGDSEVDAETAQRAGIAFFLFTKGYRKTPVQDLPHVRSFDDFEVLPQLIDGFLSEQA